MIRIGQTILISKNKIKVASFLADLFDLEIEHLDESIRVFNTDLNFLVVENPKVFKQNSNVMLDIFVSSFEMLEELHSKLEFLNYRNSTASGDNEILLNNKSPEIRNIEGLSYFFLKDPDGRKWKVSCLN